MNRPHSPLTTTDAPRDDRATMIGGMVDSLRHYYDGSAIKIAHEQLSIATGNSDLVWAAIVEHFDAIPIDTSHE